MSHSSSDEVSTPRYAWWSHKNQPTSPVGGGSLDRALDTGVSAPDQSQTMESSPSLESFNSLDASPDMILGPILAKTEHPSPKSLHTIPGVAKPKAVDAIKSEHSRPAELQRRDSEDHGLPAGSSQLAKDTFVSMREWLSSGSPESSPRAISDRKSRQGQRSVSKVKFDMAKPNDQPGNVDVNAFGNANADSKSESNSNPDPVSEPDSLPHPPSGSEGSGDTQLSYELDAFPIPIWTDSSRPLVLDVSLDTWLSSEISRLLCDHFVLTLGYQCPYTDGYYDYNGAHERHDRPEGNTRDNGTRLLLLLLNPKDKCRKQAYNDLLRGEHRSREEETPALLQYQAIRNTVRCMMPFEMQSHPVVERWFGPLTSEIVDLWDCLQALKSIAQVRPPKGQEEQPESNPTAQGAAGTSRIVSGSIETPSRSQSRHLSGSSFGTADTLNRRSKSPSSIPARYRTEIYAKGHRRASIDSDARSPKDLIRVTQNRRAPLQEIDPEESSDDQLIHPSVNIQPVSEHGYTGFIHYSKTGPLPYPTQFWHSFNITSLSSFNFNGEKFWIQPGSSLETGCELQKYHYHSVGECSTLHRQCSGPAWNTSGPQDLYAFSSPSSDKSPQREIDSPTPRYRAASRGSNPLGHGHPGSPLARTASPRPGIIPDIMVDSPGGTSSVVRRDTPLPISHVTPTDRLWHAEHQSVNYEHNHSEMSRSGSGAMRYDLS